MFSAFRSIFRAFNAARAAARASRSRGAARRRGRGAKARLGTAASEFAELIEEALENIQEAEDIIGDAYLEAITTMGSMVGNAGQASVFEQYVIPAFEEAYGDTDPEQGWPDVDIGEYMVFMGEIVGEGNAIMSSAYDDAASLIDEASEVF